ncbi:MAG: glycerol-3-phosphate dehydrogenase subunit GlpB [Actinobacteria bacterium]|nr:glycerol-3-phosphate dehydrogenase subunit GlpB [Actinomycetota bacterium]
MSGTRVVVIGAGLAGLTAAVRLGGQGLRPTVVTRGLGGLPLSPGTIDVLGYAPEAVDLIETGMAAFLERNPAHPYAQIGLDATAAGIESLREAVAPIEIIGDGARNMLLPSMLGGARPTAYAPASLAAGALRDGLRVLFVGMQALRDSPAALAAATLPVAAAAAGLRDVTARSIDVTTSPRPDEPDVNPVTMARALDDPALLTRLAAEVRPHVLDVDVVAFPAVLGMQRHAEVLADLRSNLGAPVCEVASVPPSVPGIRLDALLRDRLVALGGRVTLGAAAVGLERRGTRVTAVDLDRGDRVVSMPADAVVIATGGFASGGIVLDSHGGLTEAVADLPLAGDPGPERRFGERASDDHPGLAVGVTVDAGMHPLNPDGSVWADNVYAAGDIIGGAVPWRQLCGEGICLGSAAVAADTLVRELAATVREV